VNYTFQDNQLVGRVHLVGPLLSYEGKELTDLQLAFHQTVDAYEQYCAKKSKNPEKSYSGRFNVRIDRGDHRELALLAAARGVTLNHLVAEALETFVGDNRYELGAE
jgi:predicted HicB family RNase H-like nuclease